jgi:hypothetical protein
MDKSFPFKYVIAMKLTSLQPYPLYVLLHVHMKALDLRLLHLLGPTRLGYLLERNVAWNGMEK